MTSPLVVIVGPTASGKSALAMRVARKFNGEIICADSRTVYKGMDIGTAKPSKQDRLLIRHHLLDVALPNERFTVADFKKLAEEAIKDISSRGKLPILVGGSGLYVDSVIFNYKLGRPADFELRKALDKKTIEELQALCEQNNIQMPNNRLNKRYLIRAIEMDGVNNQPKKLGDETIVVGIATDRQKLISNIEHRAHQMIKDGIVSEVAGLASEFGWDGEAMKGNIYRVFRGVVEGNKTQEEAWAECVQSDIKLTKKQLTWFKRNKSIIWGSQDELMAKIEHFLNEQSGK